MKEWAVDIVSTALLTRSGDVARHFQHWLKAYCDFTSHSEAPLDFHFWTGVSTIAAVLRRRVWKDELLFKWTPNFYIIFVGPAGVVTKSTTLNIGYQMLRKVDGIHFGPDSMTWQGLAKKFNDAFEYVPWTGATGPGLPMSPLTCSVSELGTFLKPDDRALVSFLTDVWDGKDRPFDHTTLTQPNLKIEYPWLNVIGATTPEWMQDNFPASMLSQGIGSRVIFVYGETKRHHIAYPSRATKPADYHVYEQKLIDDLIEMTKLVGPYELTDEAYKWGEDWYDRHHSGRGVHLASGRYSGYLARKQTHMHKLAMVLAAAQRDNLIIERSDLEAAEIILVDTERFMIKVFESVGVVDNAKHITEVLAFVKTYKWITPDDCYKQCYNIMSKQDYLAAVKMGLENDILAWEIRNGRRGLILKQKTVH